MKTRTLRKISRYIESGNLIFLDNGRVNITLTTTELRELLKLEYGLRTKKRRILKKKMKQLLNMLMREMLSEIERKYKVG